MFNSIFILEKFDIDRILNYLFINNENINIYKYINVCLEYDINKKKYYICEREKTCWFYQSYIKHSNKKYIKLKKFKFKKIHYNNENNEQYKIYFNIIRLITDNFFSGKLQLHWDLYIEYIYHLCLSPPKDIMKKTRNKLLNINFLFN